MSVIRLFELFTIAMLIPLYGIIFYFAERNRVLKNKLKEFEEKQESEEVE